MSITITVSKRTEQKIRNQAARSGQDVEKIVSGLVEDVWDERFPEPDADRTGDSRPHGLFQMAGMFSSNRTDTSERMHEILYAEDLDPAQGFGTDK
ncbi:MAG: hypothetical protein K1X52_07940 [Pyrinomonadaceae bacterium]|nr:hypothetical protein [Pyrinomonadaceae bacterium]